MANPVAFKPVIINPTMTLAGQAAAFNASNTGIELIIDGLSFGRAHYTPDGRELALRDPVGSKIPLAGGSRPTPYQLRMSGVWTEDVGQVAVGEIGYWSGETLVFVWSMADGSVAGYKTDGVAYVLFNDLAFGQVPSGSINFVIDGNASVALAALSAHEGAANAHPQYMLRADMAKDSGPLAWLGKASGAANALTFSLLAAESELPGYAAGQRFQFLAVAQNTGAVTVNIEGLGAKAIKKAGETGLVDLEAGDIKPGAAYDLNYDGTYFQLGGGVGGGKAFERFSFTASVAQAEFTFPHVPGSIIVLRNGRETTDFTSSADGSKVTLRTAASVNDALEFLCFKSFHVVDSYTKVEVQALLQAASGLPVGTMLPFPRGAVPDGFLEVDGSTFSAAVYPDLAAYLGGTTLPESRGEFVRGWDHGRGVDPGRGIGSLQDQALADHYHAVLSADAGTTANPANGNLVGSANANLTPTSKNAGASVLAATWTSNVQGPAVAKGGIETRPRNLSLMWCIKAWNAPINQGQLDVGALVKELDKVKSGVPVGALLAFPVGVVPIGYLELDGSVKSIAAYPDLAAFLGTNFNKGNEGAGNFRLPESRGEFLRGWDHGRGVDPGRALGTYQIGSYLPSDNNAGDEVLYVHNSLDQAGLGWDTFTGTPAAGSVRYFSGTNISSPDPAPIAAHGGAARPRNLSVMWCIRAWNSPVNQGALDVSALQTLAGQSTETIQGTSKVATQDQVNAGTADDVIVTPKKLRWGFSFLKGPRGYIVFPSWLGGLIIQWASVPMPTSQGASNNFSWPLTFPNFIACTAIAPNYVVVNPGYVSLAVTNRVLTGAQLINNGMSGTLGAVSDTTVLGIGW